MENPKDFRDFGIDLPPGASGDVKVNCPKCEPTRKHKNQKPMSVNVEKGVFFCHNCGESGGLGGKVETSWINSLTHTKYKRPPEPPQDATLGPNARAFLEARGIEPLVALDHGLYSDPKDTAIAIPYLKNGETVHIKYRNLEEGDGKRFWSTDGTEPVFYNIDAIESGDEIVIVEGELDVLALATAGIENAISVPGGAPGKKKDGTPQSAGGKLKCMDTAMQLFEDAPRVLIAVDTDDSGIVLRDELVRRIGPLKCFVVNWPDDQKDANDTLRSGGKGAVMKSIADARPVPVSGIVYARDLKDEIWRHRKGRTRRGVELESPDWSEWNELYRIGTKHLGIFTGSPGAGKSAFALDFFSQVCLSDPSWKFGIFSPEQEPPDEFYEQLITLALGKAVEDATEEEFDTAINWVDEHFILQAPTDRSLDAILELAHVCVMRHGIKGFLIDPYTEVESVRPGGMGESEFIGKNLSRIRAFAQRHDLFGGVVAHPTKPQTGSSDEKPVGPYDISGSANWFNKADVLVSVHRPDRMSPTAPVDVFVMKTRRRAFGRNGKCSLGFDTVSGRYYKIGAAGPY